MIVDNRRARLQIEYPCRWTYKVIGADKEQMRAAIANAVGDRPHNLAVSNRSKRGTYVCLTVELVVDNEEFRLSVYRALADHPSVTLVL
jgi:hypothetical protein